MHPYLSTDDSDALPLDLVTVSDYPNWLDRQDSSAQSWLALHRFEPEPGAHRVLPDAEGGISKAVAIIQPEKLMWQFAGLAEKLPEGLHFVPSGEHTPTAWNDMALGWMLGLYRFTRYKAHRRQPPTLCIGEQQIDRAEQIATSIALARDLINTPTNDMGPAELAEACAKVAQECGAEYRDIVGDALLTENYPTIHAVGRASDQAPRLIDLRWGKPTDPLVTIVGKGVCFDSGGLNLKTGNGMTLMKKDMGGAATALALARLIMLRNLPVRLRLLVPAVQNSVSANAFRPGDILKTRKGLTVEIGNTDAEGRLILCDALAEADSEKPDLLIDMATLTGASRVAVGTDLPSFFTDDETLAADLARVGKQCGDMLWRLPLWDDYEEYLESPVADTNNIGGSYAGAIVAALFLRKFVARTTRWVHVDMMAWNIKARSGRPVGGEAQSLRTFLQLLEDRYRKPEPAAA